MKHMADFIEDQRTLRHLISERLQVARGMSGNLSREEVAAKTGGMVSASYLRRIEGGMNTPSLEKLWVLCQVYNVSLTNLFNRIDDTLKSRRRKTA